MLPCGSVGTLGVGNEKEDNETETSNENEADLVLRKNVPRSNRFSACKPARRLTHTETSADRDHEIVHSITPFLRVGRQQKGVPQPTRTRVRQRESFRRSPRARHRSHATPREVTDPRRLMI